MTTRGHHTTLFYLAVCALGWDGVGWLGGRGVQKCTAGHMISGSWLEVLLENAEGGASLRSQPRFSLCCLTHTQTHTHYVSHSHTPLRPHVMFVFGRGLRLKHRWHPFWSPLLQLLSTFSSPRFPSEPVEEQEYPPPRPPPLRCKRSTIWGGGERGGWGWGLWEVGPPKDPHWLTDHVQEGLSLPPPPPSWRPPPALPATPIETWLSIIYH